MAMETVRAREREAVCQRKACSHKRISHGSFDLSGQFVGIGLGVCDADGPDHDVCVCHEFATLAPVPIAQGS
jgi:hypothetical protein